MRRLPDLPQQGPPHCFRRPQTAQFIVQRLPRLGARRSIAARFSGRQSFIITPEELAQLTGGLLAALAEEYNGTL
ncbi:hypothetical protein [Neisseria iguanae]|uniref:Uncharacterized protein n=1 Tax=Neisseria iguanae TaxID=90242 RepID=A0A2P7TZ82_9NEIS|nr:hypothetical protein [Neisseria iguanae]PSJ80038.1 hypothetical protein C7N83_08575 [Neisseria iguanae]